ncbi:hypothetical protein ACYOEI_17230 [Singulisphaera rosea]
MRRDFTLADGMIYIAATGVGLSITREWNNLPAQSLHQIALGLPLLAAWSVATFLVCLRQPRPDFKRLGRQPGAVACGIATAFLLVFGILVLIVGPVPGSRMKFYMGMASAPWWVGLLYRDSVAIGAAVAGAWLSRAIAGIRRPDPSWIDRLGRLLGVVWILYFFAITWSDLHR